MTTTQQRPPLTAAHDLRRWPAMATPTRAWLRACIAGLLLRHVADVAGIRVEFPGGKAYGPAAAPTLTVHDTDSFLTRLGRDGKIGFGEAFMAGDWDATDLVGVLEHLARHVSNLVPPRLQRLRRLYDRPHPAVEDNTHSGARRNIARHYDLSNDLFAVFLDETLTYSAALFDSSDDNLADAQRHKIDRLLDALDVSAGTRLLEIGTGWGELAIRAASRGAHVTTVTLSVEQASLAIDRIIAAGLEHAVDVQVADYRDVDGSYDAIVSVEMIEAVGERWWPTYLRTLDARLRPGGLVGLQTILMPHDRMLASRPSWTWIHKYIFPGGQIPSEQALEQNLAEHTRLRVIDRVHFGSSYARTLQWWRNRFITNTATVESLGFDETFRRMWTFYLCYCEAGFRAGYLDVAQFILTRPDDSR